MKVKPLSDQDRALWQAVTKDVTPLQHQTMTPPPHAMMRSDLVTPRPPPHHTLDLHGMTLAAAHEAVLNQVSPSQMKFSHVTLITGKSGEMCAQLPHWISHLGSVRKIDPLPGGGAFRVWLKKPKNKSKL